MTKEQVVEFIRKNNIQSVSDIYKSLEDIFKDLLQSFLETEIEESLGYEKYDLKNKRKTNSRNGYSQKTVKTKFGEMELDIPRDREGEFEPKIISKNAILKRHNFDFPCYLIVARGNFCIIFVHLYL